ncbi:hypothetical protein Nmel_006091 [Mimus melanotis]
MLLSPLSSALFLDS